VPRAALAERHNHLYHAEDLRRESDAEYDRPFRAGRAEEANSPWLGPGRSASARLPELPRCGIASPMLSIGNAFEEEEVRDSIMRARS
jgi:NAD-dependent DNA ligase